MSGDLVAPGAREPRIGMWDHALAEPNLEDASFAHGLSALAGIPGLRAIEGSYRKKLRLKSWQYMTASNAELFVAFIVGTAGFASNGFIYVVERGSGRVHKRFAITPLGRGTQLSPTSAHGGHHFEGGGLAIDIANHDGGRRFSARIETRTEGDDMPLRMDLEFTSAPTDEHFAICTPLEDPAGADAPAHPIELPARTRCEGTPTSSARSRSPAPSSSARGRSQSAPARSAPSTSRSRTRSATRCGSGSRSRGAHAAARRGARHQPGRPDAGRRHRGDQRELRVARWPPHPARRRRDRARHARRSREHLDRARRSARRCPRLGRGHGAATATLELAGTPLAHVEQRLDVPLVKHRLLHVVTDFTGALRTADGVVHALDRVCGIAEDNDTWW